MNKVMWKYFGANRLLLLLKCNVFIKAHVNVMCCYLSPVAHIFFFILPAYRHCLVEYALCLNFEYYSSRLRCLTDIESKLAAVCSDIQNLRDTSAQMNTSEEGLRELEVQWEDIHKTLSERSEAVMRKIKWSIQHK